MIELKDKANQVFNTMDKTIEVEGLGIYYREAGSKHASTILLLDGFK